MWPIFKLLHGNFSWSLLYWTKKRWSIHLWVLPVFQGLRCLREWRTKCWTGQLIMDDLRVIAFWSKTGPTLWLGTARDDWPTFSYLSLLTPKAGQSYFFFSVIVNCLLERQVLSKRNKVCSGWDSDHNFVPVPCVTAPATTPPFAPRFKDEFKCSSCSWWYSALNHLKS